MTPIIVLILVVVVVATAEVGLLVARSTRRKTYASRNTANMKQPYAAASFGRWRKANNRSWLKEELPIASE